MRCKTCGRELVNGRCHNYYCKEYKPPVPSGNAKTGHNQAENGGGNNN